MEIANKWQDYEILDMADGKKIERWGTYLLERPDPQIIWNQKTNNNIWNQTDAIYHRNNKGGGNWEYKKKLPECWTITYGDLKFNVKTMGFKHTGIFPEQAINWEYMINKIKRANHSVRVLNLFAYTGAATVACAYAGASVCHVDSSKGMVAWAKENLNVSGLSDKPVRFIVDDVIKFVEKEIRRGNKYDVIIMDPPSYGRGANGELWNIEVNLFNLIKLCEQLLSEHPLFFLINSYTTGLSPNVLFNLLILTINKIVNGKITCGEIGLPMKDSTLILPCGIYGRWESNES